MKDANTCFITAIWLFLLLAWLTTGDQFLDLMFSIPELGALDEAILDVTMRANDIKKTMGLADWFDDLRSIIHQFTNLK